MFLLVGMVERRCGTGDLEGLGGMARERPVLATILLVAGLVALGIVLAAMYVLRLISAVLHERPGPAVREEALDLRPGELALILPLVACLLALSVWPALVSESSFFDVQAAAISEESS